MKQPLLVESDTLQLVADYLKRYAFGPANAKTQKVIGMSLPELGVDCERTLRAIANQAPDHDLPIVSGNDGYYWATCFQDFEPMLSRLRHQRDAMHNRILAVERMRWRLYTVVPNA